MSAAAQPQSRLQFASPAWIARLQAILTELVAERAADLEGVDFTICEVFTDVPPDGHTAVWAARITPQGVTFFDTPIPADYEVAGDYAAVLPGALIIYEGVTAEELDVQAEHRRAMIAAGRLSSKGDLAAMGKPLRRLLQAMHDRLARECL